MEGINRLVSESLARHGFDRPLDYRRLHWSRWFRCESLHSLLSVPSKPGVFAVAEELMEFDTAHVGADALARPAATTVRSNSDTNTEASRMLAVTQFFEADDMAFVLDRMLTHQNPMRARLASGSYFVRYVAIDDEPQRRSICAALNQWIANSGEKVSGIGAHFAMDAHVATGASPVPRSEASGPGTDPTLPAPTSISSAPHLDSGAATNIHCPSPLPSGF
jgi:hypothetical protein